VNLYSLGAANNPVYAFTKDPPSATVVRSCLPLPVAPTCPPMPPLSHICGDHWCHSGVEDCANCPTGFYFFFFFLCAIF